MYLVGKVNTVVSDNAVAWDPVRLCLTKGGAERACQTMEYFFIRIGLRKLKDGTIPTFPRRIKE